AAVGTAATAIGVEVLPGIGITGQALRDRRLVVSGPPGDETGEGSARDGLLAWLPSRRLRAATVPEPGTTSTGRPLAAVPALHAGRVTATLTVGRTNGRRPFDADDQLLLTLAAPTVGVSVANWLLRRQLREASLRDPLTGLYNRAYVDAALEQLLALRRRIAPAERPPLSVILFDVDDFRTFNELHGRKQGDAVLRAISALLRGRFRQSDVLARISGDSFLVVLDGADARVAARAAAEIRRQVQHLALTDERGAPLHVTISAGCATFHDETERTDGIVHAVEAALDTARWSGPGAIVGI
ncbi:MAG: sensor domain-containing diguanylate cyclase, partial [Chloroflexota bacterium]|nr:sensor domain-containing diguanylate cyclase [Chloroflexota bacterium]